MANVTYFITTKNISDFNEVQAGLVRKGFAIEGISPRLRFIIVSLSPSEFTDTVAFIKPYSANIKTYTVKNIQGAQKTLL